jgi:hypothetical protein
LVAAIASFYSLAGCGPQSANSTAKAEAKNSPTEANTLERALIVGKSTKADFTVLTDAGGLENKEQTLWRGYKVASVETTYDAQGKLKAANLVLFKNWPGATLASNDNLRSSMQGDCGNEWERTSPEQLTATLRGEPRCRILAVDGGKVDVILFAVDATPPAAQKDISAQPTTNGLPSMQVGESYALVRQKLLGDGWKPFHSLDADACQDGDPRCKGRPEMESCAGTGAANCRFLWQKGGSKVAILTVGEDTIFEGAEAVAAKETEPPGDLSKATPSSTSQSPPAQATWTPPTMGTWRCATSKGPWRTIQFLPGGKFQYRISRTDMSGEGSYEWERTEKLLMTEIIGGSVVKLTWTIMEQKPSYWIMMNQASLIVTCER